MRVTFWDFDGVLADSEPVVAELAGRYPATPYWKWWHDPATSTAAALMTSPLVETWELVASTPGRHAILTARCRAAVMAWLAKHGSDTTLAPGIRRIEHVFSTSRAEQKHIPASVKKALFIERFARANPDAELHFYDDSSRNLWTACARVPELIGWKVVTGRPCEITAFNSVLEVRRKFL